MKIVGAGMAGLLAANMLRRHKPVVYEQKAFLPDNHAAVLRFRNEEVSRATGIPFRQVMVHKAMVLPDGSMIQEPNLKYSNMYSQKVTGRVISRSIMSLASVERFIAPANFIHQMAVTADIAFGADGTLALSLESRPTEPIISTAPMPSLMKEVDWEPRPNFEVSEITVLSATIEMPIADVFQTIYFPNPDLSMYRASLTGNQITPRLQPSQSTRR